ncbi:hypothetical protein MY10362_004052 [Beauveria mimosiformis]
MYRRAAADKSDQQPDTHSVPRADNPVNKGSCRVDVGDRVVSRWDVDAVAEDSQLRALWELQDRGSFNITMHLVPALAPWAGR